MRANSIQTDLSFSMSNLIQLSIYLFQVFCIELYQAILKCV